MIARAGEGFNHSHGRGARKEDGVVKEGQGVLSLGFMKGYGWGPGIGWIGKGKWLDGRRQGGGGVNLGGFCSSARQAVSRPKMGDISEGDSGRQSSKESRSRC